MLQVYRKGNLNYGMNGDLQPETISAETDIKLNSEWEMIAVFPASQEYAEIITDDVKIKIKMPEFAEDQLWYVYKTEKDDDEITTYLRPVFWQSADDCILLDVRPTLKTGQEALEIMCEPNGKYSGRSDITTVTTAYYYHKNLIEAIQGADENSFLNRWGGEILYNNFEIIVNERVGGDYGARAEMGYNIRGVEETVDTQDVITRIYPIGFNGRMLTGTQYIDSPNIGKYSFIHTRFITFEDVKYVEDIENTEERAEAFQTVEEFEAELRRRVQLEYDAGADIPKITYTIDFVELSQTTEYQDIKDLVSVGFGDTVRVRHRTLGIDTVARCIERKYDHASGMVTEIVLGDFSSSYLSNMDSVVAAAGSVIDIKSNTVIADRVAGILNAMNTQLRYQKNISQTADVRAVLFEDRIEGSPTYGAMCMGTQGLQIAKERTEDSRDWKWTTAITAEGINALAVITGILSDKKGKNYWNLDTGEFHLSQETAVNGLTNNGTAKGIYLQDGELYINASNILSGTLRLGGTDNGWGMLELYDENDNLIGKMDKGGSVLLSGKFININEKQKVELDYGGLNFYESENQIGRFGITRWANTDPLEYGMSLHANNKFLSMGCGFLENGNSKSFMLLNNGLNPKDFTEDIIIWGSLRASGSITLSDLIRIEKESGHSVINFGDESTIQSSLSSANTNYLIVKCDGTDAMIWLEGDRILLDGDMKTTGTKNRVVDTQNNGVVSLNAFETTEPYFSDIGAAVIPENGYITTFIDPVMAETIDMNAEYQVFITDTSEKGTKYVKKYFGYFEVYGEAGAKFDWMLCAKQRDYSGTRMEVMVMPDKTINFDESVFDGDDAALKIVEQAIYEHEREVKLL